MLNGTYGGVRGKETKVGQKPSFPDLLDCWHYKNTSKIVVLLKK